MLKFQSKGAILWDNDGVLVDTEKYFYEAARVILKKAGIDFTVQMFTELVLVKSVGPWHLLKELGFNDETILRLKAERDDLYMHYLQTENILIDGVAEILEELSGKKSMGVVTSSKPIHFYAAHERTKILRYIDFVITPEDYKMYKPDPEPYLLGWKRTNMDKNQCLVVEDSRRGLISAKAAGLDCIVIPNEMSIHSDFTEADMILNNLTELKNLLS
ncbi:MAG TPA: HAD family phosphatase [Bacteroidales bacterium]|nr:HAD family phosphatase [Bacteroidales bacterium]